MTKFSMSQAKCSDCGWVYDICSVPNPVSVWVAVAAASYCPMCGNQRGNLAAPARALTEAESAQKRWILAAPVNTRKVPK